MGFEKEISASFEPMVSIIVPVYNGANYMREAIDSALAQSYKNIEVIVVNDGSRDDGETDRIALSYGSKIRYIHKENGGVSTALNEGIRNMKGEYFSWLSHDDVYNPDKVKSQIEILRSLEDKTTVIKCRTEYIDGKSNPIKYKKKKSGKQNCVISWDTALKQMYRVGSYNGCTLLIHKSVFEKCGMFDEDLRFNQDGFMWSKIFLSKYSMMNVQYVGVKSRIHSGQLTRKGLDLFHRDSEVMSEYLIPRLLCCSDKKRRLIVDYAKNNAKYQNKTVVKRTLKAADKKQITPLERVVIHSYGIYGNFRAVARNLYYSLIRRIKIKRG